MSNIQKLDTLRKEIDNLVALLVKVDEDDEPMVTLEGQKQKVLDVLPVTPPDDGVGTYPMHKLLACSPLTKTEIPLDVLEKLIESGFNVNSRYNKHISSSMSIEATCLSLAIRNDHFAAVRWLVQHGADCNIKTVESELLEDDSSRIQDTFKAPIAELAHKANAPLDLFDLLATPHSLADNEEAMDWIEMPLQIAIAGGYTENALRLIKLKSPIDSGFIKSYIYAYTTHYNDELFTYLIPSETHAILDCVYTVLKKHRKYENESEEESDANARQAPPIMSEMLNRLFQYIIPEDEMCICFEKIGMGLGIAINFNKRTFSVSRSLQHDYWWSLLLVNLGWTFRSTPQSIVPLLPATASEADIQIAHRIDGIWKTYRDTCSVTSLQNLCIQQTRKSMRDFREESFMNLPVPNKLRKLLMYQHVAEIAYEDVSCKMKKG